MNCGRKEIQLNSYINYSFIPTVANMLVITFVLIVGLLSMFYCFKKRKNYPPGPWITLPIIGNLHLLDPLKPYITLTQLSKKYGPIYGLQMGSVYTVVVSNDALIRDAFKGDQFMGRAPLYVTHGIMGGYGKTERYEEAHAASDQLFLIVYIYTVPY